MEWPRRWRARWIWWFPEGAPPIDPWTGERTSRRDAFVLLRRAARVQRVPAEVPCRVTCDGRYVLFVNGAEVGRGPVRSEPAHLTYDTYDLAPLMRPGMNCVAVLARHCGRSTTTFKRAPVAGGALGCGGLVLEAEIGGAVLATDATWRARGGPWIAVPPAPLAAELPALDVEEGPPPTEHLDARGWPGGWTEPGFDDAAWDPVLVLEPRGTAFPHPEPPTEPFAFMAPRPIPPLRARSVGPLRVVGRARVAERPDLPPYDAFAADRVSASRTEEGVEPLSLEAGDAATFAFEGIVCAHVVVSVEDASDGAVLDLACGEDLAPDGTPVVEPRNWFMRVTLGRGARTVASFEAVGFRYLRVAIRAGSTRGVRVWGVERLYPRDGRASFEASAPVLGAIWRAGVRTLDLCSTDAFVDCPGREQRAWISDAYLHTLVSSVCSADTALLRWNMRLHAQGARADGLLPMVAAGDFTDRAETIPDGTLHWVRALARVWERTGDRDLARELLPTAVRALDAFERLRAPDGLLADVPGWVFVDWAQTERASRTAVLDALYALALADCAGVADACGDPGTAAGLRVRAAATRAAFERYWDHARGVYSDAADADRPLRRVSQHTNALAILCGAAVRERWDGILDAVCDPARVARTRTPGDPGTFAERVGSKLLPPAGFDEERCVVEAQPWFAHFLHQALAAAGRTHSLLGSIRRWEAMLARGDGCFGEHWDAQPGLSSRAHAWSATPAYDLPAHVLGVRPAAPGWDSIAIAPSLGDLAWAEGTVTTPRGDVRVRADDDGVRVETPVKGTLRWEGRRIPLQPGRTEAATSTNRGR